MALRLKGEASFTDADLGEVTLRFDASVFLHIEDNLGVDLMNMSAIGQKLGLQAACLAAAIAAGTPGLVLDRTAAADLLLSNSAAGEALARALEAALPKAGAEGNGKLPKAA